MNGNVYLKRKFSLPHSSQPLGSAFCPLMSFLQVSYCHLDLYGATQPFSHMCRVRVWCQVGRMEVCISLTWRVALW